MNGNDIISLIKSMYKETWESLREAEVEYNKNRRSIKKRETVQFVAAQEMILSDLCAEIGVELWDDNLCLID